jgi:hypothetical protein
LHEAIEAERYADAWNNLGCVHYLQGYEAGLPEGNHPAGPQASVPTTSRNVPQGSNELDGAEESFTAALRLDANAGPIMV